LPQNTTDIIKWVHPSLAPAPHQLKKNEGIKLNHSFLLDIYPIEAKFFDSTYSILGG
jgi:hypothetical protein